MLHPMRDKIEGSNRSAQLMGDGGSWLPCDLELENVTGQQKRIVRNTWYAHDKIYLKYYSTLCRL